MSLSDHDINIIKTISFYSVMDELERYRLMEKKDFIKYYESLTEPEKIIISSFTLYKAKMMTDLKKIVNDRK